MSCETLNIGAINLNVAVASLPEGFCPSSMQELANAIGERLIITPSTNFNSFAIGSIPPTSNVGPWLKDCLEWFVYDDATATYGPIAKGGFNDMQYFTANATFTVPDFITKLKIHAFGAGGGGSNTNAGAQLGSGGGGGAYGLSIVDVIPGQVIPIVVGTGGANGATGTNGGNTTILGRTAGGGFGAGPGISDSGDGGTAVGFEINLSGQGGASNSGGATAGQGTSGGDAGGWGGKGGAVKGNLLPRNGTEPGGGGSGGPASAFTAGSGANGSVLIEF